MKIADMFNAKRPVISLEIFPPKKDGDVDSIYQTLEQLKPLNPDFISVTYSAAGSGGTDITFEIASSIKHKYGITALPHLTCIQSDPGEIDRCLGMLKEAGIENIMALRGDLPEQPLNRQPHFTYAKNMVAYIKERHPGFCIGAAAYPEGHLGADSFYASLDHLKEKVDAGADFLVTQLFFDNNAFYQFYEETEIRGINLPITAGIMPILGRAQIERMIFMCGVSLPSQIIRILHKYEHDQESLVKAGIEYSNRQIQELISFGVDGIHIYTMNRPEIAQSNIRAIESVLQGYDG